MATWEDGPEYAPALRPDHFAEPAAAALPVAAPVAPPAPAPVERPAFSGPQVPVAPLDALVPPVTDARDPSAPFEVAAASITEASSAWSAAHWTAASPDPSQDPSRFGAPPTPFPVGGPEPAAGAAPASYPASYPESYPAPFPAPGTTQWFAPPPPPYAPPAPARSGAGVIAQTLTLGVIICLVIGGIVWPLAPVALGVAFVLASRVRAGRPAVLALFTTAASVLVVVGVVGALLSDDLFLFFSDWWELVARWAQVLCWLLLVAGWIVVWRVLRSGAAGAGPTPTAWG